MNQFFFDELKCIVSGLGAANVKSDVYAGDEINIVADEHSLAAYLAGFFLLAAKKSEACTVNLILEGENRDAALTDQIREQFGDGPVFNILANCDEYEKAVSHRKNRHFFYLANLQLPEYENEDFLAEKKNNLNRWLKLAEECAGSFLLIPIFNFNKPLDNGLVSVSEREIEAVVNHDPDFRQGRILLELEEMCRKAFSSKNIPMNVVRFDNIFGPLVTCTSKLPIDAVIDDLAYKNRIVFRKSDSLVSFTGCYIRQAVMAVYMVNLLGKNGNVYHAANYCFTLHDVKDCLYNSFVSRNPRVEYEEDLLSGWAVEKVYEGLGNLKIKSLGWPEETPLQEALYRTALIKIDEEYVGDFYVTVYQGKLERIKRIEMEIMREIDRICRENDINYFLVGGSLLGAIRHKGFIPWDDDIDIGMLREDFEKFRKLCPKLLASHLSYQSYTDEPTSHYIFDKVRLKGTYFSTKFSNRFSDIENGLFIDILVYDKTANSKLMQKFHINSIRFFRRLINIRWVGKARRGIHYTASKIMLPIMKKIPFPTYHHFFEWALQMFDGKKNSHYLIDGVGQNLEKGPFPMEWFEDLIDVPYEDMVFKAPKAYDEYLQHWYGKNYMELLPLSSRNSGHALSRLDLGKYLYSETEQAHTHEIDLDGELYETPIYEDESEGMNQIFLDELSLIDKEINDLKFKPNLLNKCEINVICDEHTLAAYLAGYYMYKSKKPGDGAVNLILEGKCRNKALYDQIFDEFEGNSLFNIYSGIDEFNSGFKPSVKKVYYYLANLQLPEYNDDDFVREKKRNLRKWLGHARSTNGRFVFIPIFNFVRPFPDGVAAISEREIESLVLCEKDFRQGRILMELEDVCRKSFSYSKNMLKILRFDNIFGPFVQSTSKLGLDEIIRELVEKNSVTFKTSDSLVHYSGCYIRQAVSAVHCVAVKGKKGNIYNAANYNFTLHDVKTKLYNGYIERNPEVKYINDVEKMPKEKAYEVMGNLKMHDLGWTEETPLDEALYTTAFAEFDADAQDKISQRLYQGKLDQIRSLEVEIMKSVDEICRKNSIKYFLVGGSLLGAVKYQGYIPWEDSIDIGMFREDYEKFRQVCPGELSSKLKYQSYEKGSKSHFVYDKIRLKETSFYTAASNRFKSVDNGLFINVFVYDRTANNSVGRKIHCAEVLALRRLINVRWLNTAVPGPHYRLIKLALPFVRLIPFETYHAMLNRVLTRYDKKENCVFLIDGEGPNLYKGAFPAKWFYSLTQVEFEGLKLPAPAYYDQYLKLWYGEKYMRTIPASGRNSGRRVLRIDLGNYLYDDSPKKRSHKMNAKGELYDKRIKDE